MTIWFSFRRVLLLLPLVLALAFQISLLWRPTAYARPQDLMDHEIVAKHSNVTNYNESCLLEEACLKQLAFEMSRVWKPHHWESWCKHGGQLVLSKYRQNELM